MSKPLLIGMTNPYSPRPEHALWPDPPGCTGWRTWRLLADLRPDVTQQRYLDAFERWNVLGDVVEWDARDARVRARELVDRGTLRGRTVVLLGDEVRRAFVVPKKFLHPQELCGVTWRQVPHPSGLCRFYNDETNRLLVGLLLEQLYDGGGRLEAAA